MGTNYCKINNALNDNDMKKNIYYTLFLTGFWMLLLGIAVPVKGQTLTTVFSDDFESRTVGTTATANGYLNTSSTSGSSQVIASGTGSSGTKYVNMTGSTASSDPRNCYLTKQVGVTSGQTYIFSIYTLGVSNKASTISFSGTSLGTQNKGSVAGTGAWQKRSYTFTATATENVNFTVYVYATGNVYVDDILLQRQQWNVAASANNVSYGSVSGTGLKDPGTSVSLTATPSSGYYFVNWTEGGSTVSTSATYTFTATSDRTLMANFESSSSSITVGGTLSSFTSTYGSTSAEQSFTVSGSSLLSSVLVIPPSNFEVSLTSGSGFQSSVSISPSSGTIASTPVYIRMKATAPAATYNAANITINNQTLSCSGTVSQKALTMSGLTVPASKIYNGTTTAVVTDAKALQATEAIGTGTSSDGKPYTGDAVSITGTPVGTYNSKDVSSATTVTYSGLSLTGAQAANYTLTIQGTSSATITAKALTMTGLSVPASKIYDGTTSAIVTDAKALLTSEATGTGTTSDGKPYIGDEVSITGTPVGTYNSKNVTSATTVTYSGLSLTGAEAANYTLTIQGTSAATITAKALSVSGYSIAAKDYNGNTTSGTITKGTITGFVGSETVTATATCTLSSPNVYGETGTIVYTLVNGTNGGLASNYSLANKTYWAQINQRQLNITAGNQTVTYGTAASAVTAAGTYTPTGFVGSDNSGIISGTATYTTTYTNTTAAGTSGVTITYDAGLSTTYGNYWINKPTGTITITKANPTLSVSGTQSFTYNGSAQGPATVSYNGDGGTPTLLYTSTDGGGYSSEIAPTNAGAYQVVASAAAGTNYNAATSSAYAFSITAAANNNTGGNITDAGLSDVQLANTDITVTSGELVINTGKTVRSITVNGGAKLTVPTGQTLTLTNLTLKSDASSTSTFKPEGTGSLVVTGTTAVEQYLANTRNYYVSSPVSNAIAPAGYTYYGRDESLSNLGWVPVSVGAGLTAGKGYIALPGAADAPITFTTQSGGSLNTGNVTVNLTYTPAATSGKGYNLIGNPYPSHLNWTKAFTDANVAKIEPSIWYRTKVGNGNTGGWSFKTYNAFTGDAVPLGTTGIIPPMQGFWVLAKQTTTIQFTDDMRSHETGNALKAPAAQNLDRKKLRLQVSNGTRADEALLVFDANASDNYDSYDSPKMLNNATDIADIYTVADAKKLVINGMNDVEYDTEIPIGFGTLTAGDFSISRSEMTNFEAGTRIMLIDKLNPTTEFELTDGVAYNFSAPITAASTDRFSLLFRAPGVATGIDNASKLNTQVFVNAANQIVISAPVKSSYAIYNAMGQLIENGAITSNYQTSNFKLAAGVYVVKVGNTNSTRVIIK